VSVSGVEVPEGRGRRLSDSAVTIKDVARLAEVSTATVSRVMNEIGRVDPVLAARVRAAASELDYRPSAVARNLRLQQTAVWLLMISDIENPFFTLVARGVEDVANREGYSVVLCNTDESADKETRYIQVALQEQAAGVIISPASRDTDVSQLVSRGVPVVALDRPVKDHEVDRVLTDSRQGAHDATVHLFEQGWRRVACITGPAEATTAERRALGYRDAIKAMGARFRPIVAYSDFRTSGGQAAAADLLDSRRPPDAFFVANNLMALGVLEELRGRGIRPGRDVGIVSFDDPPWARLLDPPLSCVAQPSYDIGAQAATLLADRLSGRRRGRAKADTLSPTLIVRRSSLRE
jgi:LacI family transcriptional regulator